MPFHSAFFHVVNLAQRCYYRRTVEVHLAKMDSFNVSFLYEAAG